MTDQPELFPEDAAAATPRRRAGRQRQIADQLKSQSTTRDSFQNFGLNLGLGTDNALTGSTYGFNPITRIRTLLEWIYRGSWVGAIGVDLIADDMTRMGVELHDDNLSPEDIGDLEQAATRLCLWTAINDVIKWARLYGGAIGVMMVDGQDMSTPLRIDTIRPGQFKGIAVFDRWSVVQSAQLIEDLGPQIGNPVFYTISDDAPGLRGQRVHWTRVLRLVGVELPWNQRVAENMWGLSIIERLYDRMVAFDSATQGAAQLVYKSYVRTYKIKGMRQLNASGGDAAVILARYLDLVRKFQGIEGMTLIDADDDMVAQNVSVHAGISDALVQFGQQISGALQIPLVRMFGQSPAGLNSTGESDLRTYYDNINNQQNKELRESVLTMYRVMAASEGKNLSDGFNISFRSLWQMTEPQKSEVAERDARTVGDLVGSSIIDKPTALKDLRQLGKTSGRFQNITDQTITDAENEPDPVPGVGGLLGAPGDEPPEGAQLLLEDKTDKTERRKATGDKHPLRDFRGLQLMIETHKGEWRRGPGWATQMPLDYGFIRGTESAEGAHEQMDVFVGDNEGAAFVYVIDGGTPEGVFDEHKLFLGLNTEFEALYAYRDAYHDARKPVGITALSIDDLIMWLATGPFDVPLSQHLRDKSVATARDRRAALVAVR